MIEFVKRLFSGNFAITIDEMVVGEIFKDDELNWWTQIYNTMNLEGRHLIAIGKKLNELNGVTDEDI